MQEPAYYFIGSEDDAGTGFDGLRDLDKGQEKMSCPRYVSTSVRLAAVPLEKVAEELLFLLICELTWYQLV